MIKKVIKEYAEGKHAKKEVVVKFLDITIYKFVGSSTHNQTVRAYSSYQDVKKVKGFTK